MNKLIILIALCFLLFSFGWGRSNWGHKQHGSDKYNGIQWGESSTTSGATYWETAYGALWTTAYGAMWTEPYNTEIP